MGQEILEFEEYSPDVISFDKLIEDIQIKIWDRLSFAKSVVGESEFKKWMKNETDLSSHREINTQMRSEKYQMI